MDTRPPLPVYLYGRHVADVLDTGAGGTAIRYTQGALSNAPGSRLSLSLPVREDTYITFGPGGRWVRSLLPEGRALAWAVQEFGVPEDDRYGLIAVLGADVAGAVQILAPGQTPDDEGRYERTTPDEVVSVVKRAHDFGLGLDRSRGIRLSLAGMQDKVLLHQAEGEYLLPVGGAPSTLIVKPEPSEQTGDVPGVAGVATNELLCGVLARRCGLDVAEARVEQFGTTSALVVTRYDRPVAADGTVQRIHQEDLLGAMGEDPLLKYERPTVQRVAPAGGFAETAEVVARPGPTLARMAELLAEHLGLALLGAFAQAVTYNIIIGNADAHARNYSVLLHRDGRVQLAPLYDLICTRYWDHLDSEPAQMVAGKDCIDAITASDLVGEVLGWGVPPGVAARWVEDVSVAVGEALGSAREECVERGGDPTVSGEVADLIAERLRAFQAET